MKGGDTDGPQTRTQASDRFVVDSSIVLAWFFTDESDDYADAVARRSHESALIIPSLFHLEIANTLVVGERRKRCTKAQSTAFLERLAKLPFARYDETIPHAWTETIRLARRYQLSEYDASYLELTLRISVPLASLDEPLIEAAQAAGVPLLEV